MSSRPILLLLSLSLDVCIGAVCLWNLTFTPDRAAIPAHLEPDTQGRSMVKTVTQPESAGVLRPGDRIVRWDDVEAGEPRHLELLADMSRIGDHIRVTYRRGGLADGTATITLVPFYPTLRFPIIFTLTGLSILALGLFVYLKRPTDPAAIALHWVLVSLGAVTMMTQGATTSADLLSDLRRSMLFLTYAGTAGCFLLFSVLFPVRRIPRPAVGILAFVVPFVLLGTALSWLHVDAMHSRTATSFHMFQQLYAVFHFLFLLALVAGLFLLFRGYHEERVAERRAALRWMFWGILAGASPFLLLVILPQLWGPDLLVAEEIATLCMLAVPVSLSVAFLRYRVFRIEIQRYQKLTTLMIEIIVRAYLLLVSLTLVSIVLDPGVFGADWSTALLVGLLTVMLFKPGTWLVTLLEESIYPSRANLTRIIRSAVSRFGSILSPSFVGPALAEELYHYIPRMTFAWYSCHGERFQRQGTAAEPFPESLEPPKEVFVDLLSGRESWRGGSFRNRSPLENNPVHRWLATAQLSVLFPVRSASGDLIGSLAGILGTHADPLDQSELDLVHTLRDQAVDIHNRLLLQEQVIVEQQERQRLEELNRMQSHFVSGVSHDLRTPLTSASLFLEMLERPDLDDSRRREYIEIIRQETKRLSRLVENVLDFTRMGRGIREFRIHEIDPAPVLREAAEAMASQFLAANGEYTVSIPDTLPPISADAHALERAIVNVLSNAFKYTTGQKRVALEATAHDGWIVVTVSDNGVGIPAHELSKVFTPFHRVQDVQTAQTGGVGLGLSLVKHTIESHGGVVSVASEYGKGTTVTIRLPAVQSISSDGEHI